MRLHRARTAVLLVLALLAGLPGALGAACGPICPSAARMALHSCCRPAAVPSLRTASCCETVQTAAPTEAARAVNPPAPLALALAAPLALPAEPLTQRPAPEPSATPPPLHEGVGLYTLHSVFLI